MPSPPDTIGVRIRLAREKAGFTRRALALHLGCTEQSIVRWERGETCSVARLASLAAAFGVSLAWLVEPAEPQPPKE